MAEPTASSIVRTSLAIATWGSLALSLGLRDVRFLVAGGVFGTLWWIADAVLDYLLIPLSQFIIGMLEGDVDLPLPETRPTIEDTIRLLEHHIEGNASRNVQIQSAIRLADLYRVADGDVTRSRDVIDRVRARFPDADELKTIPRVGTDPV
jgi:hypothetical protein